VQEVDDHISALSADIAALQALLRRDPEVEKQRARSKVADDEAARAVSELAAREQELATLERRTQQLDRRLYDGSVHNPAELLEMQRELEGLRGQLAELENRILALMESNEVAAQEAGGQRARLAELEARRATDSAPRREHLKELQRNLAEATQAREALLTETDAGDLALYRRVASHRHPAVVSIKGDACGGCHLPLSNEERRAVRAGDSIVQCSNCDRILVP
jgi:uncharacterized protein